MRRTPVVLGILSMVFGGLIAAYSAFGLATQSMAKDWSKMFGQLGALAPQKPGAPDMRVMMESMSHVMDELRPYTFAISGGFLLFSNVLVGIGWGLYKRQAWSRMASIGWSQAALAFIPFQIFVQTHLIQPKVMAAMKAAFTQANMPSAMFEGMMGMQSGIVVVTSILFYAPFPVILLILMGRQSAKGDLLT
jgi:hypothetical protein